MAMTDYERYSLSFLSQIAKGICLQLATLNPVTKDSEALHKAILELHVALNADVISLNGLLNADNESKQTTADLSGLPSPES